MYASHRVFSYKLEQDKNLFINTLNGMCLLLPDNIYEEFKSPGLHGGKALNFLTKYNFVFSDKAAESTYFMQKYDEAKVKIQDTNPSFALIPNFLCNFNCWYCFEPESLRKQNKLMSLDMIRQAFNTMNVIQDDLLKNKTRSKKLFIMGGEVLLPHHMREIEEILIQSRLNDMKVELVTNGYFLKEYAPLLTRYKDDIAYLQITFDGDRETHNKRRVLMSGKEGTFDRIVEGIDAIKDQQIPIKIRMNLDESNSNIQPFIDFVKAKGWAEMSWIELHPGVVAGLNDCVEYNNLIDEGNLQEIIQPYKDLGSQEDSQVDTVSFGLVHKIYAYLKNISKQNFALQDCLTNRAFTFVPDGTIHQCATVMHKPDQAIGKFFPHFEMKESTKRFGWDKIEDAREEKGCMSCSTASICPGPCPIQARKEFENGTIKKCDSPNEIVYNYLEMYKEQILKLPLWTISP